MKNSEQKFYKNLYLISGVYDLSIGFAFLFFSKIVFETLGIPEKAVGSEAYLSLVGAFLLVLSIAYFILSKSDLTRNKNLVLVGALYKLAYFLVALWYFAIDAIPHITFLTVFGVIDIIMFVLMMKCYKSIK